MHRIGGWVGLRASLDAWRREIFLDRPTRNLITTLAQLWFTIRVLVDKTITYFLSSSVFGEFFELQTAVSGGDGRETADAGRDLIGGTLFKFPAVHRDTYVIR